MLVDYWAEWCGPCKMIAPVLDDMAKEYSGQLNGRQSSTSTKSRHPAKFGIRGIPTLIMFKNGKSKPQGRRTVEVATHRLC